MRQIQGDMTRSEYDALVLCSLWAQAKIYIENAGDVLGEHMKSSDLAGAAFGVTTNRVAAQAMTTERGTLKALKRLAENGRVISHKPRPIGCNYHWWPVGFTEHQNANQEKGHAE